MTRSIQSSARLDAIDGFLAWKAAFDADCAIKGRGPDATAILRRRFEDFLDDLIAAHDLDAVDVDMATFDELLAELDRMSRECEQ